MAERDFKGIWIPKEVWLDNQLSMLDKGILVEIDSLDMSESGCYASNEHLAKFCQCSTTKVSTSISKLIELGYITVASFDGRKRFLKSRLSKNERQTFKRCEADSQIVKDSNISNNPSNNTDISISYDELDFESFWNIYPRHVAKQNAIKAWKALKPNKELIESILANINRRLESEWRGKDMQYIPHPSTYLNQRRWEDETEVTRVAKPEPTDEDLFAGHTPEEIALIEQLANDGEHWG